MIHRNYDTSRKVRENGPSLQEQGDGAWLVQKSKENGGEDRVS